jgi:hypothetical protein
MAREPFSQTTFNAIRDKIENITAEKLEERLKDISTFAVNVSPEDTGAYVESFSIGRAGFSGGRSKSSKARGGKANGQSKEIARSNLLQDIQSMNIKQMLEQGLIKFTLRNKSPHASKVEDGWFKKDGSKTDGYHVFRKIRSKFR